jgi:hypothetical protein
VTTSRGKYDGPASDTILLAAFSVVDIVAKRLASINVESRAKWVGGFPPLREPAPATEIACAAAGVTVDADVIGAIEAATAATASRWRCGWRQQRCICTQLRSTVVIEAPSVRWTRLHDLD